MQGLFYKPVEKRPESFAGSEFGSFRFEGITSVGIGDDDDVLPWFDDGILFAEQGFLTACGVEVGEFLVEVELFLLELEGLGFGELACVRCIDAFADNRHKRESHKDDHEQNRECHDSGEDNALKNVRPFKICHFVVALSYYHCST